MLSWFHISTNLAKVYFATEHHNMQLIAVWFPTIYQQSLNHRLIQGCLCRASSVLRLRLVRFSRSNYQIRFILV